MPAAIHASLDDANLTAEEFRVACHICRRCGDEGNGRQCDSKIETIAAVCRLRPATVRKAIRHLVNLGWVEMIERPGKTKVHVGKFPDPSHLGLGVASNGRGSVSVQPCLLEIVQPSQLGTALPLRQRPPKGNPSREPIKKSDIHEMPFDSESFRDAWSDWVQHRKEKRKPITPLSAKKALAELAIMGETRAIAAINHSISNGYQGIFEPDPARNLAPPVPNGAAVAGGRVYRMRS